MSVNPAGIHPGMNLNYISEGEGPPTILVHGLTASLHDWEVLVPELASYSYKAFAVDLFGHGESPKPNKPELYTISTIVDTFETWLERLQLNSSIVMVGHSLGGHVCLQYCLRHPGKIGCLVLIDPFYRLSQLSPLLRLLNRRPNIGVNALRKVPLKVIDTVLGWDPVNSAQYAPQARWQIAHNYKQASPYVLNVPSTVEDLTDKLSRIRIPALIIWGSNDLTLSPGTFRDLVVRMPFAQGHEISDCGHQPHIGKPVRVNRIILDFLNSNR